MAALVTLEVDTDTHVGLVRIDRPPMNALSSQVWRELHLAVTEAIDDERVRALIVWGGPKVFAAGADITEFPDLTPADARRYGAVLQGALDHLARAPMPTIAAIHGYALGGGCELALACDLRVAADNAKLGQPEVLLGLLPGAGGTQRLPRLIGLSRAKELIFSGRMVDMVEAERIGLVDRVAPADDLIDLARELAGRFAAGPASLALAKRAIEDGTEQPLDQGLRLESELFAAAFATEDAATGIASFLEHGPGQATFTGR
ncbi:MAG: enoyl-CoA hydratase/isomerase family protein [Nitriliruptor sp.]|nr:MAG: enoyl-CoA hydratase/isomerase family protein [Nitriliruptor sp.]